MHWKAIIRKEFEFEPELSRHGVYNVNDGARVNLSSFSEKSKGKPATLNKPEKEVINHIMEVLTHEYSHGAFKKVAGEDIQELQMSIIKWIKDATMRLMTDAGSIGDINEITGWMQTYAGYLVLDEYMASISGAPTDGAGFRMYGASYAIKFAEDFEDIIITLVNEGIEEVDKSFEEPSIVNRLTRRRWATAKETIATIMNSLKRSFKGMCDKLILKLMNADVANPNMEDELTTLMINSLRRHGNFDEIDKLIIEDRNRKKPDRHRGE
jgi:hypothetical protein